MTKKRVFVFSALGVSVLLLVLTWIFVKQDQVLPITQNQKVVGLVESKSVNANEVAQENSIGKEKANLAQFTTVPIQKPLISQLKTFLQTQNPTQEYKIRQDSAGELTGVLGGEFLLKDLEIATVQSFVDGFVVAMGGNPQNFSPVELTHPSQLSLTFDSKQSCNGLEVVGGGLRVYVNQKNKSVILINPEAKLFDCPSLILQPNLTQEEAQKSIEQEYTQRLVKVAKKSVLVVFADAEAAHLGFAFHVELRDPFEINYVVVDAHDGKILHSHGLVLH